MTKLSSNAPDGRMWAAPKSDALLLGNSPLAEVPPNPGMPGRDPSTK